MESEQIYNPIGGIAAVVLHPVGTPLPDFGVCSTSSVEVFLEESGSSYLEEQIVENGECYVRHTLTFTTPHGESPYSTEALKTVLRDGVIADVTLASGLQLRLGWSRIYGTSFPLRLTKIEFSSGENRLTLPSRSWVWVSTDKSPLTN
ncbi:MAG: hypothetical protein SNH55_04390 [Rikenellaceae bacterium]